MLPFYNNGQCLITKTCYDAILKGSSTSSSYQDVCFFCFCFFFSFFLSFFFKFFFFSNKFATFEDSLKTVQQRNGVLLHLGYSGNSPDVHINNKLKESVHNVCNKVIYYQRVRNKLLKKDSHCSCDCSCYNKWASTRQNCQRGLQQSETQTSLLSIIDLLEK